MYNNAQFISKEELTMKTKGLSVSIYKDHLGDCTNGGISGGDAITLVLTSIKDFNGMEVAIEAPFEGDETNSVKIVPGNLIGYYKAVPVVQPKGMVGPMFGGNFIYTSDSRFPMKYPVPIHDRYETQALNDALSK